MSTPDENIPAKGLDVLRAVGGDAEAVIRAARLSADPDWQTLTPEADEIFAITVTDADGKRRVELVNLEEYLDAPRRKIGVVTVKTAASLKDYVQTHSEQDRTSLWIDSEASQVVAVINGHGFGPGDQGWGDHRAVLKLQATSAWKHWIGKSGQMLNQEDFAEHIELGLAEIVEPEGAVMLELAQDFSATTGATIRQARRLSDGQVQVQWDENIEAKAGASGHIEIPKTIKLAIPPFEGEDPYALTARFRFRLTGGKLQLGYVLERPEDAVRDALNLMAEDLRDQFSHVYIGKPL